MADQESTQSELRAKLEELIQVLEKVLAGASVQENKSLVDILAEVPYLVRDCTYIYTHYPIELQSRYVSELENVLSELVHRPDQCKDSYSYFSTQIEKILELAHKLESAYAHALELALGLQRRCARAFELACELNLTCINDLEHIYDLALECVSGCELAHKLILKYEPTFRNLVDYALVQCMRHFQYLEPSENFDICEEDEVVLGDLCLWRLLLHMLQQYRLELDREYTRFDLELETTCERVRLDAAAPEQVCFGRVFDVAAAICLPDSPLLDAEGLTQVRSGDAQIAWSEGETRAHLRLQVTAPECQIVGADHHTFFLAKGQESVIFYFHLIPQQIGNITIIVTLYQEHDTLGNTRVRTIVVEHIAGEVQLKVSSQPVRITNYNITVQEGGNLQAGVIGSDARVQDGVNFENGD